MIVFIYIICGCKNAVCLFCNIIEVGGLAFVVLIIILHHAIISRVSGFKQTIAYRSQSSAAIDGAEHRTTLDIKFNTTGYVTSRIGITGESTTATEHVAVNVAGAPSTNLRACTISITNRHLHIAHHVAILTATEY